MSYAHSWGEKQPASSLWQAVAIATSLVYVPYGELGGDVGSKNRWMCWGDKP